MLKLVQGSSAKKVASLKIYGAEAFTHHNQLVSSYLQSHRIRNHSVKTIAEATRFLNAWFNAHGGEARPLFTWEAMEPIYGRKRILSYATALKDAGIANQTVRRYMGQLRGYFCYVLEHPYVFDGDQAKRLNEVYGVIEQPISEYDIPAHVYDGEQLGVPFEPSQLYDFYACLREKYINPSLRNHLHTRARNYAMAVVAGETGVRAEELAHLEVDHDLFFDSHRLQTRFAKATYGSGKRARLTLFPPLARDTVRYYLKNHRPFLRGHQGPYLFFSGDGEPMNYGTMFHAMDLMKDCANKNDFPVMDHFSWHWLRRLFATRFIERFPDKLSILIQILGHVTSQTVHAYIRHSEAWTDGQTQAVLEGIEFDVGQMET